MGISAAKLERFKPKMEDVDPPKFAWGGETAII